MMVTRWGLSEELGTVSYGENQDEVFLGMSVSRTAERLGGDRAEDRRRDRALVEEGYAEATQILTEKRADLEALAKGLLEFETLTGDEIKDLLDGQEARTASRCSSRPTPRSSAVPPAGKPRPRPDRGADRRRGAAAAGVKSSRFQYERPPARRAFSYVAGAFRRDRDDLIFDQSVP